MRPTGTFGVCRFLGEMKWDGIRRPKPDLSVLIALGTLANLGNQLDLTNGLSRQREHTGDLRCRDSLPSCKSAKARSTTLTCCMPPLNSWFNSFWFLVLTAIRRAGRAIPLCALVARPRHHRLKECEARERGCEHQGGERHLMVFITSANEQPAWPACCSRSAVSLQ